MKILVPIKRVLDPYMKVRVKLDGSGVDLNGVKMSMNPFCEIAMEQAIRLKEKGTATEVIAVTAGGEKCQQQLRAGLAMGADTAIHIHTDTELEPLALAKALVQVVKQVSPHLVIFGKQTIDGGNSQTGAMVATLLGWPQSTFISSVEVVDNTLKTTREVDEGIETTLVKIPAVLTCDLRLNEPRFTSLPQIMKAKSKPLQVIPIAELGVDTTPRTQTLHIAEPPKRSAGVKVDTVAALMEKLKHEAKVL